jgi:hypothetical protein
MIRQFFSHFKILVKLGEGGNPALTCRIKNNYDR